MNEEFFGNITSVRFLSSVNSPIVEQIFRTCETLSAKIGNARFFAGMGPQVQA